MIGRRLTISHSLAILTDSHMLLRGVYYYKSFYRICVGKRHHHARGLISLRRMRWSAQLPHAVMQNTYLIRDGWGLLRVYPM